MLIILFVSFVILLLIGAPIAYSMGFSSLLALILSGSTFPLEVVVQRTFSMLNSYSLLAIPFFILAGDLMSVYPSASLSLLRRRSAICLATWRRSQSSPA